VHTEDAYRPLLECLAYTGLRIGEALGLMCRRLPSGSRPTESELLTVSDRRLVVG